jgi:hypothetical protein
LTCLRYKTRRLGQIIRHVENDVSMHLLSSLLLIYNTEFGDQVSHHGVFITAFLYVFFNLLYSYVNTYIDGQTLGTTFSDRGCT